MRHTRPSHYMLKTVIALMLALPLTAEAGWWIFGSSAPKEIPAAAIGVVDEEAVLKNAKVRAHVIEQVLGRLEAHRTEFRNYEQALRRENAELQAARTTMSEAAFAARMMDFQKRVLEIQQKSALAKSTLETKHRTAEQLIQEHLRKIVAEVAAEHHLTLVLSAREVLWSDDVVSLTPMVLERLDKTIQKLDLESLPALERPDISPPLEALEMA